MTKVKTEKSQTPYYIYAGAHAKDNEVTTSGTGTIATPPQQKGKRMYLGVPLVQKSYSTQIQQKRTFELRDFEQICGISRRR